MNRPTSETGIIIGVVYEISGDSANDGRSGGLRHQDDNNSLVTVRNQRVYNELNMGNYCVKTCG